LSAAVAAVFAPVRKKASASPEISKAYFLIELSPLWIGMHLSQV